MMRRSRAALLGLACAGLGGCGWNPSRPFERDAPSVDRAIVALDAGDAAAAAANLEEYLSTGPCKDGRIGRPDVLERRPDGTYDLGLALFRLGEAYGRRFGEEEIDAGTSEAARADRHAQVTCAREVVGAIADNAGVPADLRAQARYLEGNLAFLDAEYEDAVRSYDRALLLEPGRVDGGEPVGRDAAWNRAIALRRIDDKKDAGHPDAASDAASDGGRPPDGGGDSGEAGPRPPDDAGHEGGGAPDAGPEAGEDGAPPPRDDDAGERPREAGPFLAPPPDQDERMLDQLENAPTLQQEEAKRFGKKRVRGMADK